MVAFLLLRVMIFGAEMMLARPSSSLAVSFASTIEMLVPNRVEKLKPIELSVRNVVGMLLAVRLVGPLFSAPPILKASIVIVPQSKPISRLKLAFASTTRASMPPGRSPGRCAPRSRAPGVTLSAMSVKMIWLLRSSTVALPRSVGQNAGSDAAARRPWRWSS